MNEHFNALVMHPDLNSRAILKQGISNIPAFDKVIPVKTIREGTAALVVEQPRYDIVFISARFGKDDVTGFLHEAQRTKRGKSLAYVVIVKAGSQEAGDVTGNIISGADGILCEPYSVDNIKEASEFAIQVRRERKRQVMSNVFDLLIRELAKEVDRAALLEKHGRRSDNCKKRLEKMALPLRQLDEEQLALYHELAVEIFSALNGPQVSLYEGPSNRLRQRMLEKLEERKEDTSGAEWIEDLTSA